MPTAAQDHPAPYLGRWQACRWGSPRPRPQRSPARCHRTRRPHRSTGREGPRDPKKACQRPAGERGAPEPPPAPAPPARPGPHRGVLALHAAAVEAHGGHPLLAPLHPDHALVVLLARLGLRQVLGPQGEGLHDAHRDQEVPAGQDLRAALRGERARQPHAHRHRLDPAGPAPGSRGSKEPVRRKAEKPAGSPRGAQPPRARHPPHLRAVDPALLEGALVGVAGTHVAVLTPVAGVRAANAGHAPAGERLHESQRSLSPTEARTRTQQGTGTERRGDRAGKGHDSRLERAAVVEDEVHAGELHASLPGEQPQPHGARGPCGEPRGGGEQAGDRRRPQPGEPQPTDRAPG